MGKYLYGLSLQVPLSSLEEKFQLCCRTEIAREFKHELQFFALETFFFEPNVFFVFSLLHHLKLKVRRFDFV